MSETVKVTCDWCGGDIPTHGPDRVQYVRTYVGIEAHAYGVAEPPERLDFHERCVVPMLSAALVFRR